MLTMSVYSQLKLVPDGKRIIAGETLHYKAYWGFLNIGSATVKTDKKVYKMGVNTCCKIQLAGETNGLAKLFYLNDRWVSYIDIHSVTTTRAYRRIREGKYCLDEYTTFDAANKKAEVKLLDKASNKFVLKKVYKTPENIRDVVAGFMLIRLIDLSKYSVGDKISIEGFYYETGYKIDIVCDGKEQIKTDKGKIWCYKIKPLIPKKNHVFDGLDAIDVWLSTNKSQTIIRIKARFVLGNLDIELQ